jgi:hypothetical protein
MAQKAVRTEVKKRKKKKKDAGKNISTKAKKVKGIERKKRKD